MTRRADPWHRRPCWDTSGPKTYIPLPFILVCTSHSMNMLFMRHSSLHAAQLASCPGFQENGLGICLPLLGRCSSLIAVPAFECRRKGPQTSGIIYCLSRDESECVAEYLKVRILLPPNATSVNAGPRILGTSSMVISCRASLHVARAHGRSTAIDEAAAGR